MKLWLRAVLVVLVANALYILYEIYNAEPIYPGTDNIIKSAGYPCEKHIVKSEDGYILTLFRIPHGKGGNITQRPVFYLQHGLTGSSDDVVRLGPGKALAFLLADKGYDVWIGNARGNQYNLKGTNPQVISSSFWDFSFDEMGYYDLPAVISYILKLTRQEKLYYVGFSMGANMAMILQSTRPEYQEKIEVSFAIAPAVFMGNCRSFFFKLYTAVYSPFILQTIGPRPLLIGLYEQVLRWLASKCTEEKPQSLICSLYYLLVFGSSSDVQQEHVYQIMRSVPSQTSIKTSAHFGQVINSGKFHAFDYGEKINKEKYGLTVPKYYNLHNINTSTVIIFSDKDDISAPNDLYLLCTSLPNVVEYYRVPDKNFNHLDFMYSSSAKELVYKKIFDILDSDKSVFKQKAKCFKSTEV